MNSKMGKNFSLNEAAGALGVSPHTLRAWKRQGRLGYLKMGRRILIPEAEVTRLLEKNYVPAWDDVRTGGHSRSVVVTTGVSPSSAGDRISSGGAVTRALLL